MKQLTVFEMEAISGGWCFQLVEHVFFNKRPDDFFVDLYWTREADCFTSQALNAGAQRQVIALNPLGEYFSGQMLILRHLPAIAAPVVAGDHADVEWRKQCQ